MSIFEKVRLSPAQLRTVAERRYADADFLKRTGDNARANAVLYLGGFVVECLLKAALLDEHPHLQQARMPGPTAQERHLWSLCYQSHDLTEMVNHLPALSQRLAARDLAEGRQLLSTLKTICGQWTIHARYSPHTESMRNAGDFLSRIKEIKECLK